MGGKNMSLTIKFDEILDVVDCSGNAFDEAEDVIRKDYSGRGMYGRTCLGIVVDNQSDFIAFIKELADRYYAGEGAYAELSEEMREFYDNYLEAVTQDSMGRATIYYWPRVQVQH
jgi:hypothetical protein